MIMDIIKLIRVKHWIKNILVFVPMFFSINLFDFDLLKECFIAFICFSLASSFVYIINDLKDIEKDRSNPLKRNRPLASGAISIKTGITIASLILIIDVIICLYLCVKNNYYILLVLLAYICLNVAYSFGLKNMPIIDVAILSSGFLLRVLFGGVVTNISISKWLYLTIVFGSFYLGYGKRRNELKNIGVKGRRVLSLYNDNFLVNNMYVCLALTIVSYSLWCVDPITTNRIGNDHIYWTIPLVMVIFQKYSLNIEGESSGDPVEVVLDDKGLIFLILIYFIAIFFVVYIV